MSNLRVAYVINDAAFFVSHRLPLALKVLELGGKVCLITGFNVNKNIEKNAIDKLKNNKIQHFQCIFSQGIKNPIKELIGLFQLILFLKKFKPTTVHSATAKGNLMALLACNFINNVKLVLSISGIGTLFIGQKSIKNFFLRFFYKLIFRVLLKKIDYKIIFQNKDDYNSYKSIIKFNDENVIMVGGSGVDTSKFKPLSKKPNTRNILLPARMLYEKGVLEFVNASRILKKKNIKGNFYLAGDTISINPSAINLTTIEKWCAEGLVYYEGHQYELNKLYQDVDIVCLPSWREGFPKALMEAASFGLPVITTDVPGCRDAVIVNKTALLVPVQDEVRLADAIKKLFEDTKLRTKMGNASRELAIKKFDLNYIVPQIIKLYR